MTGFGAGAATVGGEHVEVEVRVVNHRFCEVKARLPRELSALEPALLAQVRGRLARGAVDVYVRRTTKDGESAAAVDVVLAREYAAAARKVGEALGLSGGPSLEFLLNADGVLRLEQRLPDLAATGEAVQAAASEAMAKVEAMRVREGRALAEDIEKRIDRIGVLVEEIRKLGPASVEDFRRRLTHRMAELASSALGPERIAIEVALMADRMDVAEEISRIDSHLLQLRGGLAGDEPTGRQLDFLVQEIHREVNTLGSKSQSAAIGARVVDLKAEVERIREQVQNVL